MRAEDPVEKIHACSSLPIRPQKQNGSPGSDTLVYASVTVYPRGVQPFAIAGHVTFIYMKYGG